MIKYTVRALLTASLLATTCHVQAFSQWNTPLAIADQIAQADILVLAELQSVVAEYEVKLNISGEENPVRLFQDIPIKIIETFKMADNKEGEEFQNQNPPILRMLRSDKSESNDGMAFPAEPGRQVIVALQRDKLVDDAPTAYVVSQQAYHLLEGDTILVLHDGEPVDKLSFDQFNELLEKDRERIKEQAAIAEPDEVRENTPQDGIMETEDK